MNKKFQVFIALSICALTALAGRGTLPGFHFRGMVKDTTVTATTEGTVPVDTAVRESANDSAAKTVEAPVPESSIVDEVIWVVGDEPILKSDVEALRMQMLAEGITPSGNPDCTLPEQLALQKLFLHQAVLDSVEVSESEVVNGIDQQINHWISVAGSREKLEEYRKQSVKEMRQEMHDDFKNQQLIQKRKRIW